MAKHRPRTFDSISSPDDNLIVYEDRSEAIRLIHELGFSHGTVDETIECADKIARYLAEGDIPGEDPEPEPEPEEPAVEEGEPTA